MTENITFKQKETLFYTSIRAAQKIEAATGGVFKRLAYFTGKHMCWSLFLINLQGFSRATLLRRDSKTGVSLVKFAKFLRKPILKNTWERLLLKK